MPFTSLKRLTILALFLGGTLVVLPACSRKEGCPVNESVHTKPNKKGEYSKKKGNSSLFPKSMRKGR